MHYYLVISPTTPRLVVKIAPALLLVALSGNTFAQVYKCKEGGTTVFSATPCAVGAKPIDVRPASGSARAQPAERQADPQTQPNAPRAGSVQQNSLTERADVAARRRILEDEIYRKERSVSALYDELAAKQEQLRQKKNRSMNNLAGATWEQSISDEMKAVAAEYDIKIRGAQGEVDALKRKRDELSKN